MCIPHSSILLLSTTCTQYPLFNDPWARYDFPFFNENFLKEQNNKFIFLYLNKNSKIILLLILPINPTWNCR